MKRYVIQRRIHNWDPWEVCPGREYDTLEEVKAAFEALPFKDGYRIAEAYVRQNASPNPDKRGGISPMSWAMILTYIGAAGLVSQLFRLIDWIERREDGRTEKLLGRDSR